MITLEDVTMLKPGLRHRDPILEDANISFLIGERTGILAAPGSGKSTLARLLSGIEPPDMGVVHRKGPVSWPIGFAGFLHPNLSVQDNVAIFARLVGLSVQHVMQFCDDFCGIVNLRRKQMADLTPTQRAMLAYACAVSNTQPSMWIADEVITIGEPRDRKRCDDILSKRLEHGGLVFISRNTRLLKAYCERYFVLINQRLVPCDDLDVAQEALDMQAREWEASEREVVI